MLIIWDKCLDHVVYLIKIYPDWNVSNVTDMRLMFFNCSVFNQDLSSWNVSNVNNMGQMFGM